MRSGRLLSTLTTLVLVCGISAAQEPKKLAKPGARLTKVSDTCYAAIRSGGRSNAGVIVGENAVMMVDCLGSPEESKELIRQIGTVTKLPVRYVVLTHWHYDHSVGTQSFAKDVKILASEKAADELSVRLEKDRLLLGPATKMHDSVGLHKVRNADTRIKQAQEVDLGGGVKVVLSVAGDCHTVGDLIAWVPTQKVLFAGDLVWNKLHPNISSGSTFRWITALAHMGRLDATKVVPGHGRIGDKQLITAQRRYLMNTRRLVKHLAKGKVKPADIVKKLGVPEPYKDYGFEAWWPNNVRFILGELARGR